MEFSASIGYNIHEDTKKAAHEALGSLKGLHNNNFSHKTALVLADALAGYTDNLIDFMNQETYGTYQFFGGGAGDDAKFKKTHVFLDTQASTNAVVVLEILSHKPFGVGVRHGWVPSGKDMRKRNHKVCALKA